MTDINDIYKELNKQHGHVSSDDKELMQKAYDFAKKSHEGQLRRSGEPYFNHVFAAGLNCAKFGMGPVVIAAGLLHDVVEDTPITDKDLEHAFGEEIAFLVDGVTKLGTLKYRGRERHVESLRKFFVASAQDARVVVIKLADRLHNLETLQHVRPDKQERIALESIQIHSALAARLGMGKVAGMMQDLAFPYAYPAEYEKVSKLLKQRKDADTSYLDKVRRSLLKELADKDIKDFKVDYRVKGVYSLHKKLQRKDMDMDQVYDIVALRVVVPDIEDCYRVLGLIHTMWRPLPGRIKDYIAVPKPNGYQSLHTTIFTGDGGIAEIQIRTPQMHDFAEFGIASHFSFKSHPKAQEISKKKPKNKGFDWLEQLREFQRDEIGVDEYLKHLKTDLFENRIFVFTPDGDVIDLPEGSSVIDFAYAIHSDIGDHLASARVNGKHVALKTVLNNRDMVEVEHKESAHPSNKWLANAKTTMAQKKIRAAVKEQGIMTRWFG